jgi:hypothetical protein
MSSSSEATRRAGDSRASPLFFLYASPSSSTVEPLTALRRWLSAATSRRTT